MHQRGGCVLRIAPNIQHRFPYRFNQSTVSLPYALSSQALKKVSSSLSPSCTGIGERIGGAGPDRSLTISFTADPAQL